MGMKLTLSDFGEVENDLKKMALLLETSGESRVVDAALTKAGEIVHRDILARAKVDPKRITGNLYEAIELGKPRTTARGLRRISTGVFKGKLASTAPHAHLVEFGHGGPAPAPPHPFVRPAFYARADEAFAIIREELARAIDSIK